MRRPRGVPMTSPHHPRHVQNCSTWTSLYRDPPRLVLTSSLSSTDCRKVGGWHLTEMPACCTRVLVPTELVMRLNVYAKCSLTLNTRPIFHEFNVSNNFTHHSLCMGLPRHWDGGSWSRPLRKPMRWNRDSEIRPPTIRNGLPLHRLLLVCLGIVVSPSDWRKSKK